MVYGPLTGPSSCDAPRTPCTVSNRAGPWLDAATKGEGVDMDDNGHSTEQISQGTERNRGGLTAAAIEEPGSQDTDRAITAVQQLTDPCS